MQLPITAYLIPADKLIEVESVTDTSGGRIYWYRDENGELVSAPAVEVDVEAGF